MCKKFEHIIRNPMGLHARPAAQLVKTAAGYTSRITVTAPRGSADLKRGVLSVMRLAAKQGDLLVFTVEGEDQDQAAAELQAYLIEQV